MSRELWAEVSAAISIVDQHFCDNDSFVHPTSPAHEATSSSARGDTAQGADWDIADTAPFGCAARICWRRRRR